MDKEKQLDYIWTEIAGMHIEIFQVSEREKVIKVFGINEESLREELMLEIPIASFRWKRISEAFLKGLDELKN